MVRLLPGEPAHGHEQRIFAWPEGDRDDGARAARRPSAWRSRLALPVGRQRDSRRATCLRARDAIPHDPAVFQSTSARRVDQQDHLPSRPASRSGKTARYGRTSTSRGFLGRERTSRSSRSSSRPASDASDLDRRSACIQSRAVGLREGHEHSEDREEAAEAHPGSRCPPRTDERTSPAPPARAGGARGSARYLLDRSAGSERNGEPGPSQRSARHRQG